MILKNVRISASSVIHYNYTELYGTRDINGHGIRTESVLLKKKIDGIFRGTNESQSI